MDLQPPLIVTEEVRYGTVRITVVGEVDIGTIQTVRAALLRHAGIGRSVVLDLSQVDYFDAAGVRLLQQAQSDALSDGWELTVDAKVGQAVRRVLDLTSSWRLIQS